MACNRLAFYSMHARADLESCGGSRQFEDPHDPGDPEHLGRLAGRGLTWIIRDISSKVAPSSSKVVGVVSSTAGLSVTSTGSRLSCGPLGHKEHYILNSKNS